MIPSLQFEQIWKQIQVQFQKQEILIQIQIQQKPALEQVYDPIRWSQS